jgi:hypothetical protein
VTCSSNSTVHQSRAMMTTREAPGVAPKRRRAAQRPRNFAARKVRGRGLEPDGDARQGWIFQGFSSADIRSRSLNGSIDPKDARRHGSSPASVGQGSRLTYHDGDEGDGTVVRLGEPIRSAYVLIGRDHLVNATSPEHERVDAGAPRVLPPDGDQLASGPTGKGGCSGRARRRTERTGRPRGVGTPRLTRSGPAGTGWPAGAGGSGG